MKQKKTTEPASLRSGGRLDTKINNHSFRKNVSFENNQRNSLNCTTRRMSGDNLAIFNKQRSTSLRKSIGDISREKRNVEQLNGDLNSNMNDLTDCCTVMKSSEVTVISDHKRLINDSANKVSSSDIDIKIEEPRTEVSDRSSNRRELRRRILKRMTDSAAKVRIANADTNSKQDTLGTANMVKKKQFIKTKHNVSRVAITQIKNNASTKSKAALDIIKDFGVRNQCQFTTSCAIDATDYPHVCDSCKVVRFKSYEELRLHEDWCGSSTGEMVNLKCKCGRKYHNAAILKKHAATCIASKNNLTVNSDSVSFVNPYNFTTVYAPDYRSFPYCCVSCHIVAFGSDEEMRQHEDWCGLVPGSTNESFKCHSCELYYRNRLVWSRHQMHCGKSAFLVGNGSQTAKLSSLKFFRENESNIAEKSSIEPSDANVLLRKDMKKQSERTGVTRDEVMSRIRAHVYKRRGQNVVRQSAGVTRTSIRIGKRREAKRLVGCQPAGQKFSDQRNATNNSKKLVVKEDDDSHITVSKVVQHTRMDLSSQPESLKNRMIQRETQMATKRRKSIEYDTATVLPSDTNRLSSEIGRSVTSSKINSSASSFSPALNHYQVSSGSQSLNLSNDGSLKYVPKQCAQAMCHDCDTLFKNRILLTQHKRKCARTMAGVCHCMICNEEFDDRLEFYKHVQCSHSGADVQQHSIMDDDDLPTWSKVSNSCSEDNIVLNMKDTSFSGSGLAKQEEFCDKARKSKSLSNVIPIESSDCDCIIVLGDTNNHEGTRVVSLVRTRQGAIMSLGNDDRSVVNAKRPAKCPTSYERKDRSSSEPIGDLSQKQIVNEDRRPVRSTIDTTASVSSEAISGSSKLLRHAEDQQNNTNNNNLNKTADGANVISNDLMLDYYRCMMLSENTGIKIKSDNIEDSCPQQLEHCSDLVMEILPDVLCAGEEDSLPSDHHDDVDMELQPKIEVGHPRVVSVYSEHCDDNPLEGNPEAMTMMENIEKRDGLDKSTVPVEGSTVIRSAKEVHELRFPSLNSSLPTVKQEPDVDLPIPIQRIVAALTVNSALRCCTASEICVGKVKQVDASSGHGVMNDHRAMPVKLPQLLMDTKLLQDIFRRNGGRRLRLQTSLVPGSDIFLVGTEEHCIVETRVKLEDTLEQTDESSTEEQVQHTAIECDHSKSILGSNKDVSFNNDCSTTNVSDNVSESPEFCLVSTRSELLEKPDNCSAMLSSRSNRETSHTQSHMMCLDQTDQLSEGRTSSEQQQQVLLQSLSLVPTRLTDAKSQQSFSELSPEKRRPYFINLGVKQHERTKLLKSRTDSYKSLIVTRSSLRKKRVHKSRELSDSLCLTGKNMQTSVKQQLAVTKIRGASLSEEKLAVDMEVCKEDSDLPSKQHSAAFNNVRETFQKHVALVSRGVGNPTVCTKQASPTAMHADEPVVESTTRTISRKPARRCIRIVEPVDDRTLKCVECGCLLNSIQAVIQHSCDN